MQHITFECTNSRPEDAIALTAVMRDVNYRCKDYFRFSVLSEGKNLFPEIFEGNPNIAEKESETTIIPFDGIKATDDRHHFDQLSKLFFKYTMVSFSIGFFHGELFLTDEEKSKSPVEGKYYVFAVDKNHQWNRWKDLQNKNETSRVVFIGFDKVNMENVLNKSGELTLREIIQHAYHADAIVTTCTFVQSVAGAFQKPCVYFAKENESLTWRQFACCRMIDGSSDIELVDNCFHSFDKPPSEGQRETPKPCKHAKMLDELWHETRPCKGCKVKCENPKCPTDTWYASGCNPKKCRFFEEN